MIRSKKKRRLWDWFFNPKFVIPAFIAAMMILFLSVSAFQSGVNYVDCKTYSRMSERPVKYSLISGCFVKVGDHYLPREEISKRVIATGIE